MAHIHVEDEGELGSEFSAIAKPKSIPAELVNAPLDALEEKVLHVKLGMLSRIGRWFADAASLKLAAWRWLKPGSPKLSHEHLVDLQRRTQLGHVEHRQFCGQLIEACRELCAGRPRLARHLEARVAEIEFRIAAPLPGDEETARGFERLQAVLLTALVSRDPALAESVARNALSQITAIVKSVMVGRDSKACAFDANLMIPIGAPPVEPLAGSTAAAKLWGKWGTSDDAHQFFVVAAETAEPPLYLGFWIPDVRRKNSPLPGAPRAFFYKAAQAVFVDDLPPLPLDDEELAGRWRSYFQGGPSGFSGSLFISLPVVEQDESDPVAVVNVNIRDQNPWFRALSQSWLSRAAYLAAPWTTTAWHAFMLAWALRSGKYLGLNGPSAPRKMAAFLPGKVLTGVQSVPKLPEGSGDD